MHRMTPALLLFSTILLTACDPTSDKTAVASGQTPATIIGHVAGYTVVCIDGVQYLRDFHALAPRFSQNGRVLVC